MSHDERISVVAAARVALIFKRVNPPECSLEQDEDPQQPRDHTFNATNDLVTNEPTNSISWLVKRCSFFVSSPKTPRR